MSDTSQGPGWWLASDGKWYPPELWTGPPNTGPIAPASPSVPPTYPAQGSGYGAAPNPYPNYGSDPYAPQNAPQSVPRYAPYGQPTRQKTNGMAIASLVCACAGLFFVPAVLGVIFGFVARAQIARSNGTQKGGGLAIAGIIVGFGWLALVVLGIALGAGQKHTNNGVVGPGALMVQFGLGGPFTTLTNT